MRQTKITLANVLLIVATAGFGFATYIGANFRSLGDTKQSLIDAAIVAIVLGILAFAAQKFKNADRKLKTNIVLEALALLLFIVAACMAIKPFSHVFTVFNHKENIEDSVIVNISQAQSMFDEYESYARKRKSDYISTINAVLANKVGDPKEYEDYGFNEGPSDNNQKNTKFFILDAQLFPSDYDTTKVDAINWLADVNSSVKNDFGFMFGIVNIINAVPPKIDGWRTQLIDLSKFRAKNEKPLYGDFAFPLRFGVVKSKLTNEESPTMISIVLAVLAYLLMLLPYFVASRSTKSGYRSVLGVFTLVYSKKREVEDDGINVRLNR
jgi:hypothetical protein